MPVAADFPLTLPAMDRSTPTRCHHSPCLQDLQDQIEPNPDSWLAYVMIKVLENAIDKIKSLSDDRPRDAADLLEQLAAIGEETYQLSEDERKAIDEGLAELNRGEIATETQVRAVFDKYRK